MSSQRGKKFLIYFLVLCLFISSCTSMADAGQEIEVLQSTVNAVEIKLQNGLDIIGTGKAIATQVDQSGVVQTAQAVASNISDSGLISTAQFLATSWQPDLFETAVKFSYEQVPKIQTTLEAVGTKVPNSSDIPIYNSEKVEFYSDGLEMSFSTNTGIEDVVEFYENEMPNYGWEQLESITRVNINRALLHFRKGERLTVISMNRDTLKTFVQISVQDRK